MLYNHEAHSLWECDLVWLFNLGLPTWEGTQHKKVFLQDKKAKKWSSVPLESEPSGWGFQTPLPLFLIQEAQV